MLAYFERKPRTTVNDHRVFEAAILLLPQLARGEYEAVEQAIAAAGDEDRERLVQGLAASEGATALATAWTRARPGSAAAHLVLGASHVGKGWAIRGGTYAEAIDPALLATVHKHLKAAEDPLHEAARLDRARPDAFAWLISAELGGASDRDKLVSLFRAALARGPFHFPAYLRFFAAATEKWGGSHPEMFAFARNAVARAPRGSTIHALLALAFCEFALAEGLAGQHRIRRPGCANEVVKALHAWLDAAPADLAAKLRTNVTGGFGRMALNQFAVACYLCGAKAEARLLVAALGDEIESAPWSWIANGAREQADPAVVVERVRRELERG